MMMTLEEYKAKYHYETLDPQQCAAVEATEGPVLLLAVPGSGKTTTLLARLGYLVYGKGVDASSILTCTYTVAATDEMRNRFRAKFGDEYADQMEFRTINGVCARIISMYERLGHTAFELVSDDKRYAIMRDVWIDAGHSYPSDADLRLMSTAITYVKNQMTTDKEADSHRFNSSEGSMSIGPVYRGYKKIMQENRWMDYDDQMVYALSILKKYPTILQQLQAKYKYFCVDEAQDTSKIQHQVIAILAAKSRNLLMVGDEDQSIYGFRAAWPQALMNFEKDWPGAKVLLMEQNYRSTPQIVAVADEFIKRNKTRRDKHMNAHKEAGSEIVIQPCSSRLSQYVMLANMAAEANKEKHQTAILYRNNDTALPIIDELDRRGIAYQAKGVDGLFFTCKTVNDVTSFFNLVKHPDDKKSFLRLYYKIGLFMRRDVANMDIGGNGENIFEAYAAIGKEIIVPYYLRQKLKERNSQIQQIAKKNSPSYAIKMFEKMGYRDFLDDNGVESFRLDILKMLAEKEKTIDSFMARLNELQRIIKEGGKNDDAYCILSTIHSSKGLEYRRVILADVVNGVLPTDPSKAKTKEERLRAQEEECRLFYVGITRAKNELIVMSVRNEESEYVRVLSKRVGKKTKKGKSEKPGTTHNKHLLDVDTSRFVAGTAIQHKTFGSGQIESVKGDIATITFQTTGRKQISLPFAIKMGFLTIA